MMRQKKIVRGILVVVFSGSLFLLLAYNNQDTQCFVFTSVPIHLHVASGKKVLFNDEVEAIDLFVPAYFNCQKSFPLQLKATIIDSEDSSKLHAQIDQHFFKYVILSFEEIEGQLVWSKKYRFFKPIFQ